MIIRSLLVVGSAQVLDGTPATAAAAIRLAQTRVRRAATEELWWVRNRDAWVRDGGDDTRRGVATLAAWAAKWSGLLRLRQHSSHPEGFDVKPRSPLASGWPGRSR